MAGSDTILQEDSPFDSAADLDHDDGMPLSTAELAQVGVAEQVFVLKACTLAVEADIEAQTFGISCTDSQWKKAARIIDIVC